MASNGKVVKECYIMFQSDERFHEHLKNFAENDPVQHRRSTSLMDVRTFVVDFLRTDFDNITAMLQKLLRYVEHKVSKEKIDNLNTICLSWNTIVQDIMDPQGWLHQKDKELLETIESVYFCEDKIPNLQIKCSLPAKVSANKEEKKDESKSDDLMTQETFEQLTDRLLMYMTGDASGVDTEVLTQKGFSGMTSEDTVNWLQTHKKQIPSMDTDTFSVVLKRISLQSISGRVLCSFIKKNARDIRNILVGQDAHPSVNVEQIVTELTKIIKFEMLKEKIKNDLIPKFDIFKNIAKKRMEYHALGGREGLDDEQIIEFKKSETEIKGIEEQWGKRLSRWSAYVADLRKRYNVLSYFTVNDMRSLNTNLQKYFQQGNKIDLLADIASKISFINPNLSIRDIEQSINLKKQWNADVKDWLYQLGEFLSNSKAQR
ncbi:hypothetical protein RFI_05905 [Reticulomyxa filosa]|uniref:Uncharacterized protein n=1 Tax=Reticulomyxa filosa TaxID=46433 RepID=X6NZ16_RETFI|nr:hypothetical protein RFI_05905 [Reticulomyxa filosa]|eukprot:ETO31216.1 hypothetical protein RFI_05905 [Reticulomyxa filosa]